MAEHSWPPSEPDLEAALRNLGPHVPYPPTPPIAASVRQRLAARVVDREAGAPRTRRSLTQRAPVGVARRVAAALVLAALVLGGTTLSGGRASALGSALGAVAMFLISNVLSTFNFGSMSGFVTQATYGAILVLTLLSTLVDLRQRRPEQGLA